MPSDRQYGLLIIDFLVTIIYTVRTTAESRRQVLQVQKQRHKESNQYLDLLAIPINCKVDFYIAERD